MALIKTLAEFKKWVRVNGSFETLDHIHGDILLVEDEQIRKYLGTAFHKELDEKYNGDSLTGLQKELLDKLQLAISNLAQESYLTINQVSISSSGIHIISDDKKKTAFKWQVAELRQSFLKKGFNGLERALEILEENIGEIDFKTWAESPASTVFKQFFINTAKEFSAEYNINDSRLTYLALVPILKKQERFLLEPVLGTDLFDELKGQISGRNISDDNEELLKLLIRPALAHLVVAKALIQDTFRFNNDAIELTFGLPEHRDSKEVEANYERLLDKKIQEALQDGKSYLVQLRNYLNEHASEGKYKVYFDSANYEAPDADKNVVFRNQPEARVYGFF